MFCKSTDGGVSWSAPAMAGPSEPGLQEIGVTYSFTDPTTMQTTYCSVISAGPSLAVAADGTVGVAFYDHRNDPGNNPPQVTEYWFRYSRDGGETWQELTDHLAGPFDQTTAPSQDGRRHDDRKNGPGFLGDYQGIAQVAGGFAIVFTLAKPLSGANFALGPCTYTPKCAPTDVFFTKVKLDVPLVGVVSEKIHGDAGTFDIDLTSGNAVECRSGGETGDYTLVFTFANPLTSVAGASVTGATGHVNSSAIDPGDPHNYIVNLTGVSNAQVVTVSLAGVADSFGNVSAAVTASMGVLLGDANASRRVDAADVSLVRQQTLQPVNNANFREDINTSGRIDAADVSIARQQTLTSLP
jgi:hypothetical protein